MRVDYNNYTQNYTKVVKKRVPKSQGKDCVNFTVAFINRFRIRDFREWGYFKH